jgi:hypothetical protein
MFLNTVPPGCDFESFGIIYSKKSIGFVNDGNLEYNVCASETPN